MMTLADIVLSWGLGETLVVCREPGTHCYITFSPWGWQWGHAGLSLSAITKHLFPFNVSNAHNVSLWTPINLTRRQNEQRMERPQRYQNYKKVDCLVTTTHHLLSCFLPLSLPCPDTITVVEELLEVDSFTSSSVPHLAFFQMADHRSVEGHQHLHFKYDRLRYKLRHSHFALVGSHHDDLPTVIRIKCRRLVFSISLPQMNN